MTQDASAQDYSKQIDLSEQHLESHLKCTIEMVSGKKSILKREYIENFNNFSYLSCLKQKSPVLWTLNCSYYTDLEMKDELILNMFQKTCYYFASKH